MRKSYIAPEIAVAGSVVTRTLISQTPPDEEAVFKLASAGSVGYWL